MNLSEYLKRIYPHLAGVRGQGHFVDELFLAAGSTIFGTNPKYKDYNYQGKIFRGTSKLSDNLKASFPKPIHREKLKDYFTYRVGEKALPKLMSKFHVPKSKPKDKGLFIEALCIQFENFIMEVGDEVDDIVEHKYSQLLDRDGRGSYKQDPYYPGDNYALVKNQGTESHEAGFYEKFKQLWTIKNTGEATWRDRYIECADQGNTGIRAINKTVSLPTVRPGEEKTITVQFDSRGFEGEFESCWRMKDKDGNTCFPGRELKVAASISPKVNIDLVDLAATSLEQSPDYATPGQTRTPPDQQLAKTLRGTDFNKTFIEVKHTERLILKNPYQLRMFRLDVANNRFIYQPLLDFLLKNLGRYIFTRAKMDQFRRERNLEVVGARAIALLNETYNANHERLNEELGDILLYIFLEQILGAPKLFNKIELAESRNGAPIDGGGVHLLPIGNNNATTTYQMVFGKSNIVGDIKDAVDRAFESLIKLENNMTTELGMVESTIFAHKYDPKTTEYLKKVILPAKEKQQEATVMDKAFGIFLGYSHGLKPSEYSNEDFRKMLKWKMNTDIKKHVPYIAQRIDEANLATYSFYFYILPFNNADKEKIDLIRSLLKGGI